ncbi:hypothetical protein AEAC466_18385, partial [Asticcacaulis sp. AC466]|uniref:HlyD family type I secretion periplasmic adaptor subunit n=1 Tax=Asticcacaulis sp. AC466 TaxID=1282362 RepID=UPI0003C3B262
MKADFASHSSPSDRMSISKQSRLGLFLSAAVLMFVFLWGGLAHISGAVIASGQIALSSGVNSIQHRDGGIVSEILVSEGQDVKSGQVLARLDQTIVSANEDVIDQQIWQLSARRSRLEAERDHKGEHAIEVRSDMPPARKAILVSERHLLESRRYLNAQRRSQLLEQIGQGDHVIAGLNAQVEATEQQSALVGQELASVRKLYEQGYAPFSRVSELQRQGQQFAGQRGELVSSIARTKAEQAQFREQILQLASEFDASVLNDLKDTDLKLGELRGREITTQDASRRVEIRTPVAGRVQQLNVHTRGGVVAAGETLMLVVPKNDDLIIEARIPPQKIDSVRVGSVAFVKFSALDASAVPEGKGKVGVVSNNVEVDSKTGVKFYTARLIIDRMSLPQNYRNSLVSGMPVEVHIRTKSKSALSYFLQPLADQMSRAFVED